MGQTCLRDAESLAAFRSWSEIRCRLPGLWPLILPSLRRDQHTRPQLPSSPWSWDGFSSISAAMPSPTGLSDEFLAFASLSIRSAEPGIQKAGPLDSGGCSNIFLFLECRRRRPPCKVPAHCQSDYVVCGNDVFSRCPNPGGALGMALGRPVEQVVCSGCAGMGGWNVGEQLDEPHGRLFQGPTRPRQSMSDRLHLLWKSGRPGLSRWRGGRYRVYKSDTPVES